MGVGAIVRKVTFPKSQRQDLEHCHLPPSRVHVLSTWPSDHTPDGGRSLLSSTYEVIQAAPTEAHPAEREWRELPCLSRPDVTQPREASGCHLVAHESGRHFHVEFSLSLFPCPLSLVPHPPSFTQVSGDVIPAARPDHSGSRLVSLPCWLGTGSLFNLLQGR